MADTVSLPNIKDMQKRCIQTYIELGIKLYDQLEELNTQQLVHLTNIFSSAMELSALSKRTPSLIEKETKAEIENLKLEIRNLKTLVDVNVDFSLEEHKSRKKLKEQVKTLTAQHQLVAEKLAVKEEELAYLDTDFDEHQEEVEELAQIILDRLDTVENKVGDMDVKVDNIICDVEYLYYQDNEDEDEVDEEIEDEVDEEIEDEVDEEIEDEVDEEIEDEVDEEIEDEEEVANPSSEIVDEAFKYIYSEYMKNDEDLPSEENLNDEESNITEEYVTEESEDEEYYPLEEVIVNQVEEDEVEDENKYSVEWSEEEWDEAPEEETTIEWEPVFAQNTIDTSNVPEFTFNAPNEEFDYNYLPPETPLSLPSLEESTPLFKYKNF